MVGTVESVDDRPSVRLEPRLGAAFRYSIAQNGPFLLLVVIYIALWNGWQIVSTSSYQVHVFNRQFFTASLAFVCVSCLIRLLYLLVRRIPERPLLEVRNILRSDVPYLLLGFPILLVIPVFFDAYGQFKSSMHLWVPIYADPYLIQIDRWIFTVDAWSSFSLIADSPMAVKFIDRMYILWFAVMYCAVFSAAFMLKNPKRRFCFFATYFCSWVFLGNFLAIIFDSAGPCFYSYFYKADVFSQLCRRLQDLNDAGQPLITINAQRYLLDQYKNSTDAIGEGISAFPSLHVAMAALVAIFFYDINRVIGAMAIIFCAIIFIGSIVLGWHYAIDGIASLFAVPIFWRLSKWTWGRFPMLSVRMSI
ncbi:conserved membrane hypothetical protein [Mesorhizobium plurifarium]|uniref:Inositolphosphotransferase Aur1/Ipt1 domain-containing protein n=1 Tax=Mesorhizobium plurifarium TaxID=69974 RepID=A0A090FFS2_MESPL|nr:conserved membrane hypothetical protein [Mesorhizobium plurifarium]